MAQDFKEQENNLFNIREQNCTLEDIISQLKFYKAFRKR